MILFQRLVSSSTSAILSAMQGRLERLRKGDDASIENYSTEFDQSFEDYDHNIDFDGFMQNNANSLIDEDQYLTTLIDQAKDCIQT